MTSQLQCLHEAYAAALIKMAPSCLATCITIELPEASSVLETRASTEVTLGPFKFAIDTFKKAEHLSAYLRTLSSTAAHVAFQICVHSTTSMTTIARSELDVKAFSTKACPSWGWPQLCTLEALRSAQAQGCTMAATVYVMVEDPASTVAELGDAATIRLWQPPRTFLQAFWSNSDFSDCTVHMSDTPTGADSQPTLSTSAGVFRCHRVVLAAASPVLNQLFSGSMKEAVQQELVVHDTQPDALRLLLLAAYGQQQLSVPLLTLLPLIKLADQYEMAGLQNAAAAWLQVTRLGAAALAALMPQAVDLGLKDIAESLAKDLAAVLAEQSSNSRLVLGWQLQHVVQLLEAGDGSFAMFEAAVHWAQQAALPLPAPEDAPRHSNKQDNAAVAPMAASTSVSADAAKDDDSQQNEAATAASTNTLTESAHAAAEAPISMVTDGPATDAQPSCSHDQDGSAPRVTAAATPQVPPIANSDTAWAVLLPLVHFTGFTPEQLVAARALPGAGTIPGLKDCLLEAWEGLQASKQPSQVQQQGPSAA